MGRNREVRRWNVASLNGIGLSRRRHMITSLQDSTEEGQVELSLRDGEQRVQKKDRDKNRDREMTSQGKRRRLERYTQRNNNNNKDNKDVEAGAGGTEDSYAEESFDEDYYDDYDGKAPSSTSKLNHAYQKTTRSSSPVLRVADEMIGVPIPRRARSGSVKRSNECWKSSGGGGFGEEQSHRRLLSSPLSRSINGFSPSNSTFPSRKEMKSLGPKTLIPKFSSEPSSSVQDDIEIEVVEALFDLMQQSQSQSLRKFERTSDNKSTEKLDSICNKAVDDRPICSPIISAKIAPHISNLPQEITSFSGHLFSVESRKKGDEDGKVGESVEVSASNVSSNEIKAHNKEPIALKTENSSPKIEKLSPNNNSVPDGLEQTKEDKVGKRKDTKEQAVESVGKYEVVTNEQVLVPKEEESRSCAKSNADGSTNPSLPKASSTAELVENKEARFQIDLMAPPPMPSSPGREKDSLSEMVSGHKVVSPDVQMKSRTITKDEFLVSGKRHEGKQTQTIDIKQDFVRLDFEKPHKDNFNSGNRPQQRGQNEQSQCKIPLYEGKDFAQTNLLPFVTGWPGSYHPGYIAPFQTTTPLDGCAKPSAQLQPPPFSLAHPRPKRSTKHQHIARSIHYHQQLTKTWPAACSPATLHGSRTSNLSPAPSAPNSILGKPFQGNLPAGQVLASKSSEVPNFVDAAKNKQHVLREASQQSPADNLVHDPAFILPLGQHQATGGPTNQSGPSKSTKAIGKVSLSNNSAGGPPVSSSSLPPGGATVSFNGSNLLANEAPSLLARLENNDYSFSISSKGVVPPPIKAAEAPLLPFVNAPPIIAAEAPLLPFVNASYYPSIFHVTQVQQQPSSSQPQSNCLHLVQLDSQATSTSFHKRSHAQQQIGSQTSVHHSLMQQQPSQKQHVAASPSSSKFDREMSRQDSAIIVDSRESCAQKASNGKSLAIPIHPINVALMSHGVPYSHWGNHRYLHHKGSKCGMEVTTPQAFAVSFGSMDSCTPALNVSCVPQNPAVFQMLPDVAKGGYQLVHATQVAQCKNFPVAEGKSVVGAANNDNDETRGILGKSVAQSFNFSNLGSSNPSNSVNEIATDGSARILNFLPSAHTGNQLSASSSSALTAVFSVNPPNCHPQQQQQELIQLPKQHIQQMQMTGATQAWAPKSANIPYSFSGSNMPQCYSSTSQNLVQNIHFGQSSLWKNTSLATTPPIPSLANTSSLENLTQQQQRNSRQTQISFGSSSN